MNEAALFGQANSERAILTVHDAVSYGVQARSGERKMYGSGAPSFTVHVPDQAYWSGMLRADAYKVGMAFVHGDFHVDGDLLQALRWWHVRRDVASGREWLLRTISRLRLESHLQSARRARHNIRFHYDRSNLFYQQFLDRRMVYSCAYFADPAWSLEDAQLAKLDHICRKLDLAPGNRFLDVGCGWGALVMRAATQFGTEAVGCTLSAAQYAHATDAIQDAGFAGRVVLHERDYRELEGSFDAIASVGMFEHVGRRRLREYFMTISRLLSPDGLFLNHGIVRPSSMREDGGTVFLQRRVFPGAELASLDEVIREAERAGLEVLDVENLRPHYALTCAAWVRRLQQHQNACLSIVDAETYRTWLLYLAGASVSFEHGEIEVHQVLLAKRSATTTRRLTRAYMYSTMRSPCLRFGVDGPPSSDEKGGTE